MSPFNRADRLERASLADVAHHQSRQPPPPPAWWPLALSAAVLIAIGIIVMAGWTAWRFAQ